MSLISLLLYASICFVVCCLFTLVLLLYCMIHVSTAYDKLSDDEQQFKFLQNQDTL